MSATVTDSAASSPTPPESQGNQDTPALYSVWDDPFSQPPANTLEVLQHQRERDARHANAQRDSGSDGNHDRDGEGGAEATPMPPTANEEQLQNQRNNPAGNHFVRVVFDDSIRVDSLIEDNDFIVTTSVPRAQPAEVIAALQAADLVEPGAWRRQGLHWQYENAHRHYIRVPDDLRRPLLQAAESHLEIPGRKLERRTNQSIPFKLTISTPKKTETKITLEHVPVTLKHHHLKFILSKANLENVSGLRQENGNPSRWTCWVGIPEEQITHTIRLENPVKGDRKTTPDITVRVQGRKIRCKHCGEDSHFSSRCQSREYTQERFNRPRNEEERLAAARELLDQNRQVQRLETEAPNERSEKNQTHPTKQVDAQELAELTGELKRQREMDAQRYYDELAANVADSEAEEQILLQRRSDEQKAREKREKYLADQRVQQMKERQEQAIREREELEKSSRADCIASKNKYDILGQLDEDGNLLPSATEDEEEEIEEEEEDEKEEDEGEEKEADEEEEEDVEEEKREGEKEKDQSISSPKTKTNSKKSQKELKKQKKMERKEKRKKESESNSQSKKQEKKKKKKAKEAQHHSDKDLESQTHETTSTKETETATSQEPTVSHRKGEQEKAEGQSLSSAHGTSTPTTRTQALETIDNQDTDETDQGSPKELIIDMGEQHSRPHAPMDAQVLFNQERRELLHTMVKGIPSEHVSETTYHLINGLLDEPVSEAHVDDSYTGNDYIDDSITSQHLRGEGAEASLYYSPIASLVSPGVGGTGEIVSGVSAHPGVPQISSTPLNKDRTGHSDSASGTGNASGARTRSKSRHNDATDMPQELTGNMTSGPRHVKPSKRSFKSKLSSAMSSLATKVSPPNLKETSENSKAAPSAKRLGGAPKAMGNNPKEKRDNPSKPAPQWRK